MKERGMQIRVLGPLEAWGSGGPLESGGVKQRAVLAMLALHLNQVVPTESLVEGLWGDRVPVAAVNTVQVYVSRLRKALRSVDTADPERAATLHRRGPGYVLALDPEQVDLHRFQRLTREGVEVLRDTPARAASVLREALGLWRGQPLAEFADAPFARAETPRLEQQRLAASEACLEAEMALGRHAQLIGELEALVAQHPLHEGLHRLLMLSLYRSGRQAEALEAYRRTHRTLAEELGITPGRQLQQLHQQILRADPALGVAPSAPTRGPSPPPAGPVPRQLPAPLRHFTGRVAELEVLDRLLTEATAVGAPVVISAIAGTAGIGKTALAVHWAHQVADRFPDGQLYADLRGFDPGGSPMAPTEAVRGFLDALGVPSEGRPADEAAQAALFRSRLAGRRMLVLLDNARDTAQVHTLLPGTPGCLVLVTSRNRLTGLIARAGAQPLPLDLFTDVEARALLSRRVGAERVAADPRATQEIVTSCARLPLALTLVAARAAAHPNFPLATLAGELRDAEIRLDALSDRDDPAADVRNVFSWSYRQLGAPAARLFRLLGLHPGPHVTAAAAASLIGLPLPQVRSLLAELIAAHLLVEPTPGRYAFHDLLRTYAAEQAETVDGEADRHSAIHRVLDHYLHTGHNAARLLGWIRIPITLVVQQPGVTLGDLSDEGAALAWFTAEQTVLSVAVEQAASAGLDTHTWQLVCSIEMFFDWRGQRDAWVSAGCTALAAGRRSGDPLAQALAHRSLAGAFIRSGRHADAMDHVQRALALFEQIGDRVGLAQTHLTATRALERQDHHAEALDHARQALHHFRAAGHADGQARALNAVGWFHAQLGDHHQALMRCRQALVLMQQRGDRIGAAGAWDSLGLVHSQLDHHPQARECYRHAVELFHELGARFYEANSLTALGDALHAAGDCRAARTSWQQALAILDQLTHPDAEAVRARLHEPAGTVPGRRPASRPSCPPRDPRSDGGHRLDP
jgi:DNA-binding SARP family transcriptional activator